MNGLPEHPPGACRAVKFSAAAFPRQTCQGSVARQFRVLKAGFNARKQSQPAARASTVSDNPAR